MLAFVDLEERVPAAHPLRTIKALADEALTRLSPECWQPAKVGHFETREIRGGLEVL